LHRVPGYRLECEEIGIGEHAVVPVKASNVLAHRATAASGSVVFLHSLELDGYGYRWIRLRRTHARW
jgi:maltose alpha-D-glucosyltransferase / alpha-amylase